MKLGNQISKLIKIKPEKYMITVKFIDGTKGSVDLSFLFNNPLKKPLVLEILRGNLFGKCFIENGSLAWPNGYELCPDAIKMWITEQKNKQAA